MDAVDTSFDGETDFECDDESDFECAAAPNCIIPFKHGKEAAVTALNRFCAENKLLLPDNFSTRNIASVEGVYAPFWLFDAKVEAHAGYEEKGSKHSPAYSVAIDCDAVVEKMPADASSELDDDYMDALEPFDYSEMTGFSQPRLAGYAVVKQDVGVEECKKRIVRRVEKMFENKFAEISGYSPTTNHSANSFFFAHLNSCDAKLALLPVWIVNAKHNGKNLRFMMNGQTGKLAGRLPSDGGKVWKYRALFAGAYFALFVPILTFLSGLCAMSSVRDTLPVVIAVLLAIALPCAARSALGKKLVMIVSFIAAAAGGFWLVGKRLYAMDTVRGHKNDSDYVPKGFDADVTKTRAPRELF
ncbi:hypothetical protein R80B4_02197 [Fibrobacteres bacterium R8-0-B4]